MAGVVRQPFDEEALQSYIAKNVPEIQRPIKVKQVSVSK
jgi:hypothetical protein